MPDKKNNGKNATIIINVALKIDDLILLKPQLLSPKHLIMFGA